MDNPFNRFADPYILAIFRISLSIVGIGYIGSYAYHLDFAWHPYTASTKAIALNVCFGIVVLLVIRLLGLGDRITERACSIANFVATSWLLNGTFPLISANEELYILISFWCCFIPMNSRWSMTRAKATPPPAWPIYCLSINIGAYFFTAGLDKAFDPFWANGTGLYHAFLLPWIKPEWTAAMLDYRSLLFLLNHISILIEIIILPFILISKTRFLACLCMAALFFGLIFPLRIDWIGEIGLVISIAISSICSPASSFLSRLIGDSPSEDFRCVAERHTKPWVAYLLLGATCILAAHSILVSFASANSSSRLLQAFTSMSRWLYTKQIHTINMHTTCLVPKVLFSTPHLVGIWEFRVEVECVDGEKCEPLPIFNPDKSGGPLCSSPGVPRFYQASIYSISHMSRQLAKDIPLTSIDATVADALLSHGLDRARNQMKSPVRARLLVSPIIVPYHFQGNIKPWISIPWHSVRELDYSTQKARFVARPPDYGAFSDLPQDIVE